MEKNARLKLTVRNLPYTVTEHSFKELFLRKAAATAKKGGGGGLSIASSGSIKPSDANSSVKILQFHEGQAPSKFKKSGASSASGGAMGGAAVPSWASVLVKNVAARDELIALLDQRPFDVELFPAQLVSVEFSAWERVTFSSVPREKIVDASAGSIFEDPDYLSYADALKAVDEDPVAAAGTTGLESWLAEEREKKLAADPSKKATSLVSSLIGKWYHGKKLAWELLAAEEEDEDNENRRSGKKKKSNEKMTRKERKRAARDEKRKSKKSRRVPNREQQVVAEAKEDIRKERRRQERKDEKEQKVKNHEAKLARIERQERKKEVIRGVGSGGAEAAPPAQGGGSSGAGGRTKKGRRTKEEKSGNKFTVTSTKTVKNFPSLPGQESCAAMTVSSSDDVRPPPPPPPPPSGGPGRSGGGGRSRQQHHQDPFGPGTPGVGGASASGGGGGGGDAASGKPKMKIMKRGDEAK